MWFYEHPRDFAGRNQKNVFDTKPENNLLFMVDSQAKYVDTDFDNRSTTQTH